MNEQDLKLKNKLDEASKHIPLTMLHLPTLTYWGFFKPHKLIRFYKLILDGMAWEWAFRSAKFNK